MLKRLEKHLNQKHEIKKTIMRIEREGKITSQRSLLTNQKCSAKSSATSQSSTK
jgi:hypothetical protein